MAQNLPTPAAPQTRVTAQATTGAAERTAADVTRTALSAAVALPGVDRDPVGLTQRVLLVVTLDPLSPRVDGGSTPQPPVRVEQVTALGFQVRLVGGSLPLRIGPAARFGGYVTLEADLVVSDCAVDFLAQRTVVLTVRRGTGSTAPLRAAVRPDVVRALDDLVSRTCRRARG